LLIVFRTVNRCLAKSLIFLQLHDGDEIGPRMLARIAKNTGLTPADL